MNEEVKETVNSWIKKRQVKYFSDGMKKLVTRRELFVSVNGVCIGK